MIGIPGKTPMTTPGQVMDRFIDIGNSRVKIASFGDQDWTLDAQFETKDSSLGAHLKGWLERCDASDRIHAVSVVPDVLHLLRDLIEAPSDVSAKGTVTPSRLLNIVSVADVPSKLMDYETPETLGPDRLMIAFGAWTRYGRASQAPCLCVSAGTALTVDLITSQGVYLGGSIYPGLPVLEEGMRTVLPTLPSVPRSLPSRWPGRSTLESLQWGKMGLLRSAVEQDLARAAHQTGTSPRVIVTGGDAGLLAHVLEPTPVVVDPWLLFEGMRSVVQ